MTKRAIVVAIPTYRRPDRLSTTLPLVLDHIDRVAGDPTLDVDVSLVVIDNDPAGSARHTVRDAGRGVRYQREPRPGIAAARNRALDAAAGADAVVFIDDDERPEPEWLASLVRTWLASGATGVMGRVVSEFTIEPEPWVAAGDFFQRRSMPTGTEIRIAATGNILLDAAQLRRLGVRFDDRLGTGGGEDTLLSMDIRRAGGRLVWCEESVAIDEVPPERLRRTWLRLRFYYHGSTAVVVELLHARSPVQRSRVRLVSAAGGLARIAVGSARGVVGWAIGSLTMRARAMPTRQRGAGMLAASLGIVRREYERADTRSGASAPAPGTH